MGQYTFAQPPLSPFESNFFGKILEYAIWSGLTMIDYRIRTNEDDTKRGLDISRNNLILVKYRAPLFVF